MARTVTETLRHQQAFEHYYALGEGRTYSDVATEFKVSVTAVAVWARSFNWQERLQGRDTELAVELAEHTKRQVLDRRKRSLIIVQAAINTFAKRLRAGMIKIDRVQDLEVLLRLEGELMGDEGLEAGDPLAALARNIAEARERHSLEALNEVVSNPDDHEPKPETG